MRGDSLRDDLKGAINRWSAENDSNTPDFILARYLINCLAAFDDAVNLREHWYGRGVPSDHTTMTPPVRGAPP